MVERERRSGRREEVEGEEKEEGEEEEKGDVGEEKEEEVEKEEKKEAKEKLDEEKVENGNAKLTQKRTRTNDDVLEISESWNPGNSFTLTMFCCTSLTLARYQWSSSDQRALTTSPTATSGADDASCWPS